MQTVDQMLSKLADLMRNTFNKIQKGGFVAKVEGTRGYVLRDDFKTTHLF